MSTTVKKESTKKKSTKSAQAEAVEAEAEEVKAPVKKTAAKAAPKTAAVKKTAASQTAAVPEEPAEAAEEPVRKTRGRKPKTAEEVLAEEAPVKKTRAARKPKAAEEAESAEEAAEEPAPKRKYTRRKKADDADDESGDADSDDDDDDDVPVRKPGRRSKKDIEAEVAASDDGADIETRVYNLIKNTPGGVYQNEIWKQLNIDSRKCSRILKKLLDSGQIIREEAVAGGTKTFLLKTVAEERKRNYDVLMVKGMFSPCTGCIGECRPEYCPALTFWIMNIHENPEQLYKAMGYNSSAAEPEHGEVEMPPEFLEEMEAGEYEFADEGDEDLVFE